MLSEHRDKHAARRFLRRLVDVAGTKPQRVTTDAHPPYRRAIRWILGRKVGHRCNRYLNNLTEQSHRAGKQRYYPMLGFGSFASAARFCTAFDELRQYFPRSPPRSRMGAACCAATALRSARYAASQPLVPLGLYEEKIPAPQGWRGAPCGYLAFRDSAERFHQEAVRSAEEQGWPVRWLAGRHFQMLVEPEVVADALVGLVEAE